MRSFFIIINPPLSSLKLHCFLSSFRHCGYLTVLPSVSLSMESSQFVRLYVAQDDLSTTLDGTRRLSYYGQEKYWRNLDAVFFHVFRGL